MTTALLELDQITTEPALEQLSRDEAVRLTKDLKHQLHSTYTTVVYAWQHRVWLTLGYTSWEEYLETEIGEPQLLSVPDKDRVSTIGAMVNAQMSSRAISAATGLSKSTVNRSAQQARKEGIIAPDAQVLTRNGKTAKASKERSLCEEIPENLLDIPVDGLGLKSFTPKKTGAPAEPAKAQNHQRSAPEEKKPSAHTPGHNPGLVEVSEVAMDFEDLARQVIEANGKQRFDAELITDQMVQSITRSVLTGAALLELFNLQEDLLQASESTADTIESAVCTLDRVLSVLGR